MPEPETPVYLIGTRIRARRWITSLADRGPDDAGFNVGVEAGKRATKRKAGGFRVRAKIEAGAGRVLVGVDRLDELVELGPPIEGRSSASAIPPAISR